MKNCALNAIIVSWKSTDNGDDDDNGTDTLHFSISRSFNQKCLVRFGHTHTMRMQRVLNRSSDVGIIHARYIVVNELHLKLKIRKRTKMKHHEKEMSPSGEGWRRTNEIGTVTRRSARLPEKKSKSSCPTNQLKECCDACPCANRWTFPVPPSPSAYSITDQQPNTFTGSSVLHSCSNSEIADWPLARWHCSRQLVIQKMTECVMWYREHRRLAAAPGSLSTDTKR